MMTKSFINTKTPHFFGIVDLPKIHYQTEEISKTNEKSTSAVDRRTSQLHQGLFVDFTLRSLSYLFFIFLKTATGSSISLLRITISAHSFGLCSFMYI